MEYPPKRKKPVHQQPPTGSTTNASDAVDDIDLAPNPSQDEMLDAGVQETFPASDPVAVDKVETAHDKQQRVRES